MKFAYVFGVVFCLTVGGVALWSRLGSGPQAVIPSTPEIKASWRLPTKEEVQMKLAVAISYTITKDGKFVPDSLDKLQMEQVLSNQQRGACWRSGCRSKAPGILVCTDTPGRAQDCMLTLAAESVKANNPSHNYYFSDLPNVNNCGCGFSLRLGPDYVLVKSFGECMIPLVSLAESYPELSVSNRQQSEFRVSIRGKTSEEDAIYYLTRFVVSACSQLESK